MEKINERQAIIPIKEYDELREFKKKVMEGESIVVRTLYDGFLHTTCVNNQFFPPDKLKKHFKEKLKDLEEWYKKEVYEIKMDYEERLKKSESVGRSYADKDLNQYAASNQLGANIAALKKEKEQQLKDFASMTPRQFRRWKREYNQSKAKI